MKHCHILPVIAFVGLSAFVPPATAAEDLPGTDYRITLSELRWENGDQSPVTFIPAGPPNVEYIDELGRHIVVGRPAESTLEPISAELVGYFLPKASRIELQIENGRFEFVLHRRLFESDHSGSFLPWVIRL